MFYVLQYPNFTALHYAEEICDRDRTITRNPVFNWLMYGKLPESVTLYPGYTDVYEVADAKNRYISDVTVKAIPPSVLSASIAVDGTVTITDSNISASRTSSSDTAVATVEFAEGVLTITGVAAGTAVITVRNAASDLMYTVNVTVA